MGLRHGLPPGLRNGSALHARLPGTAPAPVGAVIAFGVTGGPAQAFCDGPEVTGTRLPLDGREARREPAVCPGAGQRIEKDRARRRAGPGRMAGLAQNSAHPAGLPPQNAPRTAPRTPRHPQNRACAGPFPAASTAAPQSRCTPPLRAGCRRMRCRVGPGPQTRLCRAGHSAAPGPAHARQTSNSMDKATCRGYGKADPGAQRPAGRCRRV